MVLKDRRHQTFQTEVLSAPAARPDELSELLGADERLVVRSTDGLSREKSRKQDGNEECPIRSVHASIITKSSVPGLLHFCASMRIGTNLLESIRENMPTAMKTRIRTLTLAVLSAMSVAALRAAPQKTPSLKLAALFGDHAVLQREKNAFVWGDGGVPGEKLSLTVGTLTVWAKAGSDGSYRFVLPPQKAGGPYALIVTGEDGRTAVSTDVMFGEVWICSGQSNMAFTMRNANPGWGDKDEPLVRSFSHCWTPGTVAGSAGFSAVGGFFARELSRRLGVAVGILTRADGGTRIEAWISREGLMRTEAGRKDVARFDAVQNDPRAWRKYERWTDEMKTDPGPSAAALAWAKTEADVSAWKSTTLPCWFHEMELLRRHGAIWYRKTVGLPKDWKGHDLALRIPGCDKHDRTFVNGTLVGATGKGLETEHYARVRNYTVPAALVRDGRATVAVRVWSWAGAGGIGDADGDFSLACPGLPGFVDLYAGDWKWKDELDRGPARGGFAGILSDNPDYPANLFESRLRPLVGCAIRGAVWYQGEDNAHNCNDYYELLGGLVDDWRYLWGQGAFPFAAVQLAGFGEKAEFHRFSAWPVVREAILRLSRDKKNFGVVSAMDVGCETDIHPVDKLTVGRRLAGWALHDVYGVADAVPTGPRVRDALGAGPAVDLFFDDVADGLMGEKGDAPKGFWMAGRDGEFRPAAAKITGRDSVRVMSKDVTSPAEVRYAWAKNPTFAELRNSADLPASSFRLPVRHANGTDEEDKEVR